MLYVGEVIIGNYRGINRFNYQVGNINGVLKVFFHTIVGQASLKKVYSFFPYTAQILIYAAEDASRAIIIKRRIEGTFCKDMDKYLCFKEILISNNTHAPFTSTGQILMVAVGAKVIFDIQKSDKKNITRNIVGGLRIIELSQMTLTAIQGTSRIDQILPYFPTEEIENLPKETTDRLDVLVKESDSPLFIGYELNSIEEAYLAKKINKNMNLKFELTIQKKITELKSELLKKVDGKKLKNEELIALEKRIKAL